jgi:Flp pilus assembly pilin Flp
LAGEPHVFEFRDPPVPGNSKLEGTQMNRLLLKLDVTARGLIVRDEAQDLTEYALVVCLIAIACIIGVDNVATAVSTVFANIDKALF